VDEWMGGWVDEGAGNREKEEKLEVLSLIIFKGVR